MLFLASDIISTVKGRPLVFACFSSRATRSCLQFKVNESPWQVLCLCKQAKAPLHKSPDRAASQSRAASSGLWGPSPLPVTEVCFLIYRKFSPFLTLNFPSFNLRSNKKSCLDPHGEQHIFLRIRFLEEKPSN